MRDAGSHNAIGPSMAVASLAGILDPDVHMPVVGGGGPVGMKAVDIRAADPSMTGINVPDMCMLHRMACRLQGSPMRHYTPARLNPMAAMAAMAKSS